MNLAVLETPPPQVAASPRPSGSHGKGYKAVAIAGLALYAGGLPVAMLWSFFAGGDWRVGLLTIPHALLAVTFAGGAMAMSLFAPDPYIAEHGKKPAVLPDFD